MESLSAKRLFPRFRFTDNDPCYSKLICQNTQHETLVSTRDLSPTGIAFGNEILSANYQPGDTVLLELSPFGAPPMRCWAKIVRSEKRTSGTLYGAQFVGMPLLHQERLHNLIRSALFSDKIDTYVTQRNRGLGIDTADISTKMLWLAALSLAVLAHLLWL